MPILNATPATLDAVLVSAVAGDTIRLASGSYGDVDVRRRNFATPVRIVSADPAKPARLRSLTVKEAEGLIFEGLTFAFEPTATTVDFASVVMIDGAKRVSVLGGEITSGPAINGVPESALTTGDDGNVIGWPTCRGMTIQNSEDVVVQGVDIHHLAKGVVVGLSVRVSVRGNEIHHLRKSGIVGGCGDLLVEGNHLHSNRPWRYGQTPAGDHGDFIAIWNGGSTLLRNVTIRDNRMETGEGVPMMAMWVQGGAGRIGNVVIAGNQITGGDHQGIVVSDIGPGQITGNVLRQDRADGKPIGIIIGDNCINVAASGNIAASVSDKSAGRTGNTVAGNTAPGA